MRDRSRAASSSTSRSSTSTPRPTRSLRGAAAWLERVGVAALFPGAEIVLPSLWESVAGSRDVEWAVRRDDGKLEFTPEMAKCWAWKDELPARRLALAGKHFGRRQVLVAPSLVPVAYALTGRSGREDDFREAELTELQREIAEAVLETGPATPPELRTLVGADKRQVDAAVIALQRSLVLTNSHLVEQRAGWGAIAVDLVARRFAVRRTPRPAEAERRLAATVLASSGELSAADLGGALGWRLKRSHEVLDALVEAGSAARRSPDGIDLFATTDTTSTRRP